jgi:hypothetical protein
MPTPDQRPLWKRIVLYCGGGLFVTFIMLDALFGLMYSPWGSPFTLFIFWNYLYGFWESINVIWGIILTAKNDYYFWEKFETYYNVVKWVHGIVNIITGVIILIIYFISLPGSHIYPLSSIMFQALLGEAINFGAFFGLVSLINIMYIIDSRAPTPVYQFPTAMAPIPFSPKEVPYAIPMETNNFIQMKPMIQVPQNQPIQYVLVRQY